MIPVLIGGSSPPEGWVEAVAEHVLPLVGQSVETSLIIKGLVAAVEKLQADINMFSGHSAPHYVLNTAPSGKLHLAASESHSVCGWPWARAAHQIRLEPTDSRLCARCFSSKDHSSTPFAG